MTEMLLEPPKRGITKENAKELAAKSHEVQKLRKQLQAEKELLAQETLTYPQIRCTRVREQITMLEERMTKLLETNPDGKELNQLAQAYARLSEVEQKLSMRPNPGSLKPQAPRKSSHTAPVEPDEPS